MFLVPLVVFKQALGEHSDARSSRIRREIHPAAAGFKAARRSDRKGYSFGLSMDREMRLGCGLKRPARKKSQPSKPATINRTTPINR